ncbi:MAG: PAS domain-containing protein [Sedimentisphaerales bacterium]|nr:PAS domain-containing protein [Sedimentisphaerales bacterium]
MHEPESVSEKMTSRDRHEECSDFLEKVFSNIHLLIAYMDVDFNFIRVNNAYAKAGGHPPEFYVGKNHFELYPNQENERLFGEVLQNGQPSSLEAKPFDDPHQPDKGTTYWDWTVQPVKNDQHKVIGLVLTLVDVTQRTQQQRELINLTRDLEDQAQLLELAHDAIFVHDLDGKIIYWNRGAENTYGFSKDEVLGKIIHELLKTQFPESLVKIIGNLLSEGHWEGELGQTTKQDKKITVESRWALRQTEKGKAIGILEIDREITRRKQAEFKIQEARRYAESIIETIQVSLLVLSPELKVRSANKTFYETFCRNPQETEGKFIYELGNHQWDIPELRVLLEDILPKNTSFEDFEVERLFENLGRRTMLLNARRLYRRGGKTRLILLSIQDITQLRVQQERIRADQVRIADLTEELLMAEERERRRIAVDLHDSVGQILAFSKREIGAAQKTAPESLAQNLKLIKNHITNAIKHTRDLTFDLSPQTLYSFGLEAALEELAEKFSKEHGLACSYEADDESKPLTEELTILLYRCVRELLINIAKHAKANNVHIYIKRMNAEIEIIVADDGQGFDPAILDLTINKKKFGLVSIRERFKHIGGRFQLQSTKGKGARAILTAPLNLADTSEKEIAT